MCRCWRVLQVICRGDHQFGQSFFGIADGGHHRVECLDYGRSSRPKAFQHLEQHVLGDGFRRLRGPPVVNFGHICPYGLELVQDIRIHVVWIGVGVRHMAVGLCLPRCGCSDLCYCSRIGRVSGGRLSTGHALCLFDVGEVLALDRDSFFLPH